MAFLTEMFEEATEIIQKKLWDNSEKANTSFAFRRLRDTLCYHIVPYAPPWATHTPNPTDTNSETAPELYPKYKQILKCKEEKERH